MLSSNCNSARHVMVPWALWSVKVGSSLQALLDTLPCSSCSQTSARRSFLQTFIGAGVNVTDAMLVSIGEQPGQLQKRALAFVLYLHTFYRL